MTSVKQVMTNVGVSLLAASTGVAGRAAPEAPQAPRCPHDGNVTAWKVFNGDQAPGLGTAFLTPTYVSGTAVPGYLCIPGSNCTAEYLKPPLPLQDVATYLAQDPNYGSASRDLDLQALTSLEALQNSHNASDRCFSKQLKKSFVGQPVFANIAQQQDVRTSTSAAFLSQYWSNGTGLQAELQSNPTLIGLLYNLIAGGGSSCK